MAKKDLSKILTTGSAKQRAILLIDELTRRSYLQEELLTTREMDMLYDSFKKPNEIKLWNEFRALDETISNAILNLQGMKFEVLMNYSNLRGYILVWNSIENTELLVNSVLHEIKDQKERKRIAEDGAKGIDLLFSKTEPDQDGYIEISVDFEKDSYKDENGKRIGFKDKPRKTKKASLWYVMNNVKKEVETSLVRYLSSEKAIIDFMDERGFNIKAYKSRIIEMGEAVHIPIIGWDKYSGKLSTRLPPNPILEEIIKKYAICPNIGELKVDEAQYNWFRRYFLDGSDYQKELGGKVNKSRSYE